MSPEICERLGYAPAADRAERERIMQRLNLDPANNAFCYRPFEIQSVPGSAMIEINGVRGFLTPGDVAFLFDLATQLPAAGNYLEVGSWMGLSSLLVAHGLIASGNFDARIYCVDTWQGSPASGPERFSFRAAQP